MMADNNENNLNPDQAEKLVHFQVCINDESQTKAIN
jgi:hypothetical protein